MENEILKQEFESLKFIFPELDIKSDYSSCSINIPIQLENPVDLQLINEDNNFEIIKSKLITNLPSIHLKLTLPIEDYPFNNPPNVEILNVESWIDYKNLQLIYENLYKIWENFKDVVIYSYIDYIKTNGELGFGILKDNKLKIFNNDLFNDLINQDIKANEIIFNNVTFNCDICQNEEKGKNCTKFLNCNHIFCNDCLNNYFSHIIKRGEIENIHCPSFECTKERYEYINNLTQQIENEKIKNFESFDKEFFKLPIPIELMERFLSIENRNELINRYKILYYRNSMNKYRRYFPNRVSECPRSLCSTTFIKKNPNSKLAICPSCNFAFCSDCFHSWHGNINSCSIYMKKIPTEIIEKWIENNGNNLKSQTIDQREICSNISFKFGKKIIELAVSDYIAQQQFEELIKSGDAEIVNCPNCKTYIQRSDGCNKMTCSKCLIFFCNICGDRLDRNDPYEHYNNPMNSCFGKLFQGIIISDE
jgi:E3 ubiquitin-protein ligase RNF14